MSDAIQILAIIAYHRVLVPMPAIMLLRRSSPNGTDLVNASLLLLSISFPLTLPPLLRPSPGHGPPRGRLLLSPTSLPRALAVPRQPTPRCLLPLALLKSVSPSLAQPTRAAPPLSFLPKALSRAPSTVSASIYQPFVRTKVCPRGDRVTQPSIQSFFFSSFTTCSHCTSFIFMPPYENQIRGFFAMLRPRPDY